MLGDVLLLTKIRNGDIAAFKEVFEKYYAPLCMYALYIVNDWTDAEEVVQELFYVIWKNRSSLPVLHSLRNYLYGAVRNQSLQYVEHKNIVNRYHASEQKKQHDEEGSSDPQQQMEMSELESLVDKTLAKLPDRCRKIFSMHRDEGMKYREIADALQISVKTVEADMSRTLKLLREEIETYFNS
jgi:RNA polymerase sigma-70 factor (ECF subfamily)